MADGLERYSRNAVAGRLRDARAAKFKTSAELARAVGMKEVTVRAHENGQNGLSGSVAKKYAKALGTTAEWILYGREEPRGFAFPDLDAVRRQTAELFVETGGRRVPVWQQAKEGAFQQLLPLVPSNASAFLSLAITGFEHLDAGAFPISDDHALSAYPMGTYVLTGSPTRLDLREGDHVVVANTLPNSQLTEITVRSVEYSKGLIVLKSLAAGEEFGKLVAHLPLEGDPMQNTGIAPSGNQGATADSAKSGEAPGDTTSHDRSEARLDTLDRHLAEAKRQHETLRARRQAIGRQLFNTADPGTPMTNPTDQAHHEVLGIVLADYRQRDRSGLTIARWNRATGTLLPEHEDDIHS